jgi:LacI family transcriptional regulator
MMGLGALKAIQELGIGCPEEVALAVFDEVPGAEIFHPHLTVVSQPAYELGRQATELLIRRLEGGIASIRPIKIELQPELKIRESTSRHHEPAPV